MRPCPSCGYENNDTDVVCQYCHSPMIPGQDPGPVQSDANNSYAASSYSQPSYNQAPAQYIRNDNNNALIALIMSIVGFFACTIICGPIAIYMAKKELDYYKNNPSVPSDNKGMATAALVIGIVDTVLAVISIIGVIIYVIFVVFIVAASGM